MYRKRVSRHRASEGVRLPCRPPSSFRSSSAAEQAAVNRLVAGSNPASEAKSKGSLHGSQMFQVRDRARAFAGAQYLASDVVSELRRASDVAYRRRGEK